MGASIIGKKCARELFYSFRQAVPKSFPGRIYRRFDMGHWVESRVIEDLRGAGYEVHCVNPRARNAKDQFRATVAGGLVSGGVDGFIRGGMLGDKWHLLEIKAMVSAKYERDEDSGEPIGNKLSEDKKRQLGRWWQVKNQGVAKAQPTHYAQMQLYMGLSRAKHDNGKPIHVMWGLGEPLSLGLYVAYNTDTSAIYVEQIEYDEEFARDLYRRTMEIILADEPPERIAKSAKYPPCSWCEFKDVCHHGEPPERLCSTCIHFKVCPPGKQYNNYGKRSVQICTLHGHNAKDPCEMHTTWQEEF